MKRDRELWDVDTTGDISEWIAESLTLARSFVYSTEILSAVDQPGDLRPILLPEWYLRGAGCHTQARIVAAGLRLGVVLGGEPQ